MGIREVYTGIWWGNLREGDHLENPGVEGSVILSWMFRRWDMGVWNLIELAQDRDIWWARVKCSIEPSGSVKCREFFV